MECVDYREMLMKGGIYIYKEFYDKGQLRNRSSYGLFYGNNEKKKTDPQELQFHSNNKGLR